MRTNFKKGLRSVISLFIVLLLALPAMAQQSANAIHADSCIMLRKILIYGKRKTKDKIILRELNVKEGDCLSKGTTAGEREVNLQAIADFNRKRLMSLKLFNEVSITWSESADGGYWMNIYVIDRFPIIPDLNFEFADRNFNVWWTEQHHDLNRLNLGITLHDNNFRGNHEIVSVTGQLGYTQKLGISYERPFVYKGQKHGFGVSFFGLQNREISYKTEQNKLLFLRSDKFFMQRKFDAAVWYTYRPKYAATHMLQLAFHHYWISDTIAALNPDYLGNGHTQADILEFRYRFQYNSVDNWEYPLTGHRFIGELDNKWAISDNTFQTALNLHYDQYFNPAPKWYLAFIFRGKTSFTQSQPYIFRRNLGYDFDYIRGYEYYVIDGSDFALGRLDVKRELLNKKIRLPVRYFEVIPFRIYLKAFGDAGIGNNKYAALDGDQLNNRALYSCGLGLDIVTLYDIKVRIEYTINHLNEKGLYLHRNGE